MEWFRWYHGTVTDPKWRVIAKRAGCTVGNVVAVWATMLEDASANATERGELHGWCSEDIAALLDMDPGQVEAIREAMQGKVLEGDRMPAWDKRQPKREDGSAERARAWRERKKAEKERDGTQTNAGERKRTLDKRRGEESREEEKSEGTRAGRARPLPEEWSPNEQHETLAGERGVDVAEEAVKMRDWAASKGESRKDWDATFRNWLRNADPPRRNGNHASPPMDQQAYTPTTEFQGFNR